MKDTTPMTAMLMIVMGNLLIVTALLLMLMMQGCGADDDREVSTWNRIWCFGGDACLDYYDERPAWERKPFLLVTWIGGGDYLYYKDCDAKHVREMKYGKYRDSDRTPTGWKRWIDDKTARWHHRKHDAVLHPDCNRTETCTRILDRL